MARRFDYLADVEVFLAVAERGSFTAGAVALSSTPSVLSRAVTRLETRLGCQLLRRSTRRISLTEAGSAYLSQVRQAFEVLDNAERETQGQKGALWLIAGKEVSSWLHIPTCLLTPLLFVPLYR